MKRCFLILAVMVFCLAVTAQERSSVTITEKGQQYYIHTVAKGEGLYRISKTYEVTIDEIVSSNPHLATESLKAGEALRIPLKQQATEEEQPRQTAPKTNNKGQIEHTIQPKETLYGISKKYDVTMEAIIALNPEVAAKMPIGGVLIIPSKTPEAENSGETTKQEPENTGKVNNQEQESNNTQTDSETDDSFTQTSVNNDIPLRIAYLLPFMTQSSRPDYKFSDFYQGALLAIKEAADNGIRMEVYTYDTDKTTLKTQQVVQEPNLQNCDLIIGPAYPNQIQPVSDFAYQYHINTVIPFTNKVSDLSINPYLIQFNTDIQTQQETLANYIDKNEKRAKIIVIRTAGQLHENNQLLVNQLKAKKISCVEIPAQEFVNREVLTDKLSADSKNLILVDAGKFSEAKDWITLIGQLGATYNITLIGDYGWLNFAQEIPTPMIFVSLFNSGQNEAAYNEAYSNYYGEQNSNSFPRYDMLGYDITRYFIQCLLTTSAATLNDELQSHTYHGLICSPKYQRANSMSGFMNKQVYVLQSKQGQITVLE